jgi:hypothetical protein
MGNKVFSKHPHSKFVPKKQRLYRNLILDLVVFSTLLSFLSGLRADVQKNVLSPKKLKELASEIEVAENSISNVKIESQSWLETKTDFYDPLESWQKTPIYHSQTAWAHNGPPCKVRVDMNKEVFEWKDGPTPFGEESYSLSFDGQETRYIHRAAGPLSQTHPVKKGQILPEAPKRLEHGNFDTGAYYSLPYFDVEMYKFSEVFRLASDPNSEVASELEFTLEEFEGFECIKIRSRMYDVTYWLEPSRGFALRGKQSIARYEDGREEIVKLVKVTKLEEVAHGVWWPLEVSSISRPYAPGKPWRRFVYSASNVVANNPNFDDSVFTITFPTGYTIDDKVQGKTYKVGEE